MGKSKIKSEKSKVKGEKGSVQLSVSVIKSGFKII